jgi:hypothetical protein
LFNNVWFSDEAHFHLDGMVNKQKMWFWASENPRVIHEMVHHAPRITAWVAISSHGLLGPIFFEETVNSERYVSMPCNTSVPHLLATDLPLQTRWFIQEVARPHTTNVVLAFLHDSSDSRVISHGFLDGFAYEQNWPLTRPDLNPCDYLLSGFLKQKISPKSRKQ